MKKSAIIEKAKELGIKNAKRKQEVILIRSIQEKEGNRPCYKSDVNDCAQMDCLWREKCQLT